MSSDRRAALGAMLQARSIAIVGASARPGSFGSRMIDEVARSSGPRTVHLVNPRHREIDGRRCLPSLDRLDEAPDLVLLGVGDHALASQLRAAADIGARSAVVFGSAHGDGLRDELRAIATDAGMALCGAGCMGFVNVADGLRATGYVERADLPSGPITLVTHSGSVFSALLRTRRALGYTLAVSSGQELVTTTADYLEYALAETPTRVLALVLETLRAGPQLLAALRRATDSGVAVVILPVGASTLGSSLVAAHSGALAGGQGVWEALCEGTGALPVADLAELSDTLELLSLCRRPRPGAGIATVHDSGAERALTADVADELGVPFAPLQSSTLSVLGTLLDDGLAPGNPLDLWGSGADTRSLFGDSLQAVAADSAVSAAVLAIDLVEEYDGDTSYIDAALDAADAGGDSAPLAVLTSLPAAIDQVAAARLRAAGIPVLEGTRSGLVALRNLLAVSAPRPAPPDTPVDHVRRQRWAARLAQPSALDGAEAAQLLTDYGVPFVPVARVDSEPAAVAAAESLGYPVVLKTDEPGIAHKSDAGGVLLDRADAAAVRSGYRALQTRFGPHVLVCATAPPGVEVALGITTDPQLGPLVVIAAGGVLTELLHDRIVALPPIDAPRARRLVARLRIHDLLAGFRNMPPADLDALADAITALGDLAVEVGDHLIALDVNPLIVSASDAVAVDALVVAAD